MATPPSPLKRLERGIVYAATAAVGGLARVLPLGALRAMAGGFAAMVAVLARRRRRLAEANLAAAFPELSPAECRRLCRRSIRNAALTMVELLKLPYLTPEQLRELVPLPSLDPLREALDAGTGVVLITAHYGNWFWLLGRLSDELDHPMGMVVRRHSHPGVQRLMTGAGGGRGASVIDRDARLEMVRLLKSGGLLATLPDQHALMGGVEVDFLGRPAWTFTGPAWLARAAGARVFAAFCRRHEDGKLEGLLLPELEMVATDDREADLIENTRRINAAIEQAIRLAPENWLWVHDRWKTAAQRERGLARAAEAAQPPN